MRKEDLTVPAIIAEAIEIIVGLIYIGLQIYYGLSNHVPPYKFICNIVGLLLVYAGLTILSNHPEQVNRLKTEVCVGKVRKYTLRMLRLIKFVFVVGLMVALLKFCVKFRKFLKIDWKLSFLRILCVILSS